ncbi:MAG: SDR family oxidoreductase [Rhodospirillaceae bacterium]|nr:SDR family oxidoreductase [Rhodospirillaceae bacterium]
MPIADVSDQPLARLTSLKDRVAVVTGAAKGIGLAVCRRFAEAGAHIVLADIDKLEMDRAAAAITKDFNVRTESVLTDVTDEKALTALADTAVRVMGRLDIWVNNAGIFPGRSTLDLTVDEWDNVQAINLRGTFIGSREAARRMSVPGKDGVKGGVIINMASVAGFRGRPGLAAYSSSKHGVIGLTKSLALEFGPANIRVLGIAPTGVLTPGVTSRMMVAAGEEMDRIKSMEQQMAKSVPLGRLGVADDVARVAVFCASDMSMLMTGATIPVDAGAMLP